MKTIKLVILTLLLTAIGVACGKDKFTTVPQIKIKSISPGEVVQGDIVSLRAEFTDQEGDVDSVFVVYKWYDGATVTRQFDTLKYSFDGLKIPVNTKEGDVFVEFAYGRQIDGYLTLGGTPVTKDTTAALGLLLKDKKANKSEYKESDKIRFKKP